MSRVIVLAGRDEKLDSELVGMADLVIRGLNVVKERDSAVIDDAIQALAVAQALRKALGA